jgi:lipoate-protein ligase A
MASVSGFAKLWELAALCFNSKVMHSALTLKGFVSDGQPVEDLAREAWLLERAGGGEIGLQLTSWRGPVVVLGYGQQADEADLEWCRSEGIPVLRRLTGGTGVIHRGDLGIGLFLPRAHPWAGGIRGLYGRFLEVLEPALRGLGAKVTRIEEPRPASRVRSPVCFLDQLADTLVVGTRKAVGCAQTRRRGAVLIHAAVLLGVDAEMYARVFGESEERVLTGLAPALSGGEPHRVGVAIAEGLASALDLELDICRPEPVPARFLEPYTSDHWAPVREGESG